MTPHCPIEPRHISLLIGLLPFAAFAVVWLVVCPLIAKLSGWAELAQAYPASMPPSGERWSWRSIRLRGGMNYNNCVTFHSSPMGLHLCVFALFTGHPPISVPWGEVSISLEKRWFADLAVLRFGRAPSIPVKLRRALARELAVAGGARWPSEGEAESPSA